MESLPNQEQINQWHEKINDVLSKSSRVDVRLLGIDLLPRIMAVLEDKAKNCSQCNTNFNHLVNLIPELPDIILPQNKTQLNHFIETIQTINTHLKQSHQITPKGQLFSIISAIGMGVGVILGAITSYLLFPEKMLFFIIMGWTLGLLLGYITGKFIENHKMKNKQLY